MKFELVQHGQKVYNFVKRLVTVTYLGGALCTATLYDFLDFVHKWGTVGALKNIFPSLASQRSAALTIGAASSAF